jgi:hypothetical protein
MKDHALCLPTKADRQPQLCKRRIRLVFLRRRGERRVTCLTLPGVLALPPLAPTISTSSRRPYIHP